MTTHDDFLLATAVLIAVPAMLVAVGVAWYLRRPSSRVSGSTAAASPNDPHKREGA